MSDLLVLMLLGLAVVCLFTLVVIQVQKKQAQAELRRIERMQSRDEIRWGRILRESAETPPKNCWEVMACGREKAADGQEACPAATDASCNGLNRGSNGGRLCWIIAGTRCGSAPCGLFAKAVRACEDCAFYKQVREEEQRFKFYFNKPNV